MPEKLLNLTDEEFASYKQAKIDDFLKPPLGLSDEFEHYWPSVSALGRCFDKQQEQLEFLRTKVTNKSQLFDTYMSAVLPQSGSSRTRVVVKYFSSDRLDLSVPS